MAIQALQMYKKDPEESRIIAWYLTGIKHEIQRISKKMQSLRQNEALILNRPISGIEDSSIEMVDTIADCNNSFSNMEEKIDIERALSNLTFKQQLVTRMIYFQEMTEKEAAKELGISQPAVHSIKSRALKKMKVYIKNYLN